MKIDDFVKRENFRVTFTVTMEGDEWSEYLRRTSRELQKRRSVPGFRAGKAPLQAAANFYGELLYTEAVGQAGPQAVDRACRERGLEPVSVPAFTALRAGREGLTLVVDFYNYPEIKDLTYRGLRVERPHMAATEEMEEQELRAYMASHLNVHQVEREARMGDIVEVDFHGTRYGKPFPFDHGHNIRFLMGTGRLFAGLDEALAGHTAGDEMDLTLKMPQDFHRQDIARSTLDLRVRLVGVWAREMYELNDDFVRSQVKGASTVEEFRAMMRERAQKGLDLKAERSYERNLEQSLADAVKEPIPEAMVQTVLDRFVEGLRATAAAQGETVEQLLAREGRTLEDYRAMSLPHARRQTYVNVALDYIRSAEKLTVSQEDIEAYYKSYAAKFNLTPQEARQSAGDPERAADTILNERAMDIVRSSAVPVTVEVTELPDF